MFELDFDRYNKASFFEKEKSNIFEKYWLYAGSVSELDREKSFIRVEYPNSDIIVTSSGQKIHAFHNKCLHRGHKLTDKFDGDINLTCPYHGWSYHDNGNLKKIPLNEQYYGVEEDTLKNMKLKPVNVEIIGDFIFVNVSERPLSINEQFNDNILESLAKTEGKLSPVFLKSRFRRKFNWKLIFENLRDPIHPRFLHTQSLALEVDFYGNKRTYEKSPKIKKFCPKDVSSFSMDANLEKKDYQKNFLKTFDNSHYLNWLLLPSLHLVSPDGGTLFSSENYIPISADETLVELKFYTTKCTTNQSVYPILYEFYKKALIILFEDFHAVESVQSNIFNGNISQHLGNYEDLNININNWFDKEIYGL
jgi:phenylpropionate dioxygenase-like ring-hydroxylating dioxygenase large terminal subunit